MQKHLNNHLKAYKNSVLASLSIQKISSETRKYFFAKILVVQPFIATFAFETSHYKPHTGNKTML